MERVKTEHQLQQEADVESVKRVATKIEAILAMSALRSVNQQ